MFQQKWFFFTNKSIEQKKMWFRICHPIFISFPIKLFLPMYLFFYQWLFRHFLLKFLWEKILFTTKDFTFIQDLKKLLLLVWHFTSISDCQIQNLLHYLLVVLNTEIRQLCPEILKCQNVRVYHQLIGTITWSSWFEPNVQKSWIFEPNNWKC